LGLLVESHLGRPIKVEGNPRHPASLGATDAFAQASVLTLYDPERLQAVTFGGAIRTWPDFLASCRAALGVQRARRGAGLRILTETVTSPTLGAQLRAVLDQYPEARWHQWEPARADAVRAGTLAAFGDDVRPLHRLADADVIVALDADFLGCGPAHLAHVREFAARRRPGRAMNRLYVAESGLTPTGAKADHRLPVRAADVALLARALAAAAGVAGVSAPAADQIPARWVQAVAHDLGRHRGRSLVVAGETQPAEVQALAHLTNAALGNVGHTVSYVPAAEARSEDQLASLHVLVDDMAAGRVELLVVLGGDPAFNAPADLPFAEAMAKVPLRVHLSLYANDTAARSHWVVPAAHYLESWGDVRAFDGTVTIVQPLIAPLYAGESAPELLAVLAEGPTRAGYDIVRTRWQVAPTTAASLGVQTEDVVDVVFRGRTISAPVLVAPGQAEGSLTVHFGYGGRGPFREHGFNAYTIRPSDALWFGAGLEVRPTAERRALARTQHHLRMEGRDIVGAAPIEPYHASAGGVPRGSAHARESLYPAWDYPGYRWGMAIDLSACVGCNACVVACQAENNIPVVGKTEVLRGREMHWLRIDTYFTGDPAA